MEEEDLLDANAKPTHFNGKREPFLTTICILTFVGAGLGLIGSLFSYFALGMLSSVASNIDSDVFNDQLRNSVMWNWIFGLVANLLCLTGALLMWNLKKAGFIIYVIGQVIPLGMVFLIRTPGFGGGGLFNSSSLMWQSIAFIPAIAFIAMYAVNLKRMK